LITNTEIVFPDDCIKDSIDHAREVFPDESCGAIIDEKYVRFENKADDKSEGFMIKDDFFDQAYIDGHVQCVIHSHDDYPMATFDDQVQQLQLEVPFGIINLKNGSVTHYVFWGDTLPIEPLEGRHFFYGVWDCYGMIRDYIKLNHNIIPPNPARDWVFWYKGAKVFEDFIQDGTMPFEYIEIEEVQTGDFLLYNIEGTKYINHIGVMLDNGLAMHHLANEISRPLPITVYREFLNKACRFNPEWDRWKEFNDTWRKND
jgi:proteasome lid subunit RPN8/RPN11